MGKKQAVQKKKTRVLLGNPYSTTSPTASLTVENKILKIFQSIQHAPTENQSETVLRKELVLGLNAVTRHAEKGTLCGVLLACPVRPEVLCQHLVSLCAKSGIPLVSLSQLNTQVAKLLGVSSLMALGIKKMAEKEESAAHELYKAIQDVKPVTPNPLADLDKMTFSYTVNKPVPPQPTDQEEAATEEEEQDFIPLGENPVFPDPCYPKELDTLEIKVKWTASDLSAEREIPLVKRKLLLDPKIVLQTSSENKKKKRKKK